MLYLNAENPSSIGDDTFWLWLKREFPAAEWGKGHAGDTVIQYSTRGAVTEGARGIGLLWELHPEMSRVFGGHSGVIDRIHACASSCEINLVPTSLVGSLYDGIETTVLPIGLDFDLWKPLSKETMREKHGIPMDARVGMWCGTTHPMKGYDILVENDGDADYWIIVWKPGSTPGPLMHGRHYRGVTQPVLAELMGAADFYAVPGRLRPYFLVEYEAMACDLPLVIYGEREKDFAVPSRPRESLKSMGWDRRDLIGRWEDML